MKKRANIVFWIILAAAVLVRCVGFPGIPNGINQDEAMAGMDAWALSKYGTDRYGMRLPVHFEAWRYGQMSVLLSYCMIPFIKLFGFGTLAVRLPMLLASCGSIALAYLIGRKIFSKNWGLLFMALTAVNPWHFMQSRWSLDCNLFPHVFLLAFYLLLLGLEKRRWLYLSMIFFGLTFYCYGVAVYSVIPFLVAYAAWCLLKKQLKLREVLVCVLIFTLIALPEIMVMAINFFGWQTIETPFFTMGSFPGSVRNQDILFLNFSMGQLWRNLWSMVKVCLLQYPGYIYNALPGFGAMYYISVPFMLLGIADHTVAMFREKNVQEKTKRLALWGFLLMGVWVGLITFEVNVNRINIIFFPLIFLCGYGIMTAVKRIRTLRCIVPAVYGIAFLLFLGSYFTSFVQESRTYYNVNFLQAAARADQMEEYDRLYITADVDWQFNWQMSEILTQYACRIDAAYYQEKTNVTGGRELLPYSERYHFIDVNYLKEADPGALYIVHVSELGEMPFAYNIIGEDGSYVFLEPSS